MEKLKNKNTVILIISAVMVLAAVIIAVCAFFGGSHEKKPETVTRTDTVSTAVTTTEPVMSYVYKPGKYKVATSGGDSLCLRLEPNTASDRIFYIDSGTEVDIIAIWEDWGYTVYGNSGGWLSLNYLELVSVQNDTSSTEASSESTTSNE